jgi:tetratricopeptide (TPR) repeat protein
MIVRNAQDLLASTLESVEMLADEVVIMDTGSTDGTCDVARKFGAKLIERPWIDDFGKIRNNTRSHCTGDWILWLDAGERLSHDGALALRDFINDHADRGKAYMVLVAVPAAAGNIAGEQIGRVRLVPNRADLRFEGRVREQIRPSIETAGLVVEGLPFRVIRSTRDHEQDVKLIKARRDLKLLEAEIAEHGQQPRLLEALGECLGQLGEPGTSAACFRKAIQHSLPGSSTMREAYYGLLTSYDQEPNQRSTQIAVCIEALEVFPLDAQLLCAMGGYLQAQDRLELAARSYQTAFEYGQVDPETWHVPDIREIAAVCLSLIQQIQLDDDAALSTLQMAIDQNPSSPRVLRHIIDLHIKHNRRKEALDEFDKLPMEMPQRESLRSAIRGACLAAKQNWAPALAYLQTAHSAGCRDPLCLRWLAVTLTSLGDVEAAVPVLRQWVSAEPRNGEAQRLLENLTAEIPPERPASVSDAPPARRIRVDAPQPIADGDARSRPAATKHSETTKR